MTLGGIPARRASRPVVIGKVQVGGEAPELVAGIVAEKMIRGGPHAAEIDIVEPWAELFDPRPEFGLLRLDAPCGEVH